MARSDKMPTFAVLNNSAMIQEFRVSNFLSFRDETVLSFEPVGTHRRGKERASLKDFLVYKVNENTELLRLAVFYGANASGKSNILKALDFLVSFCKKKTSQPDAPTGVTPFMLNSATRNLPSKFNLRFFINGERYWYNLELDSRQVYAEALYIYKSAQPTAVFKRTINTIEFNPTENTLSAIAKEQLQLNCLPNESFFASRAKVNIQLNHIDKVIKYFDENFLDSMMDEPLDFENLYKAAEEFISENSEAKQHLLRFLKEADFNISGVTSKKQEIMVPEEVRNTVLADPTSPKALKDQLREKPSYSIIRTFFTHQVTEAGKMMEYTMPSRFQSLGTRRVFALESYLYALEETNRIALLDEFDSSLHPNLADYLISKFANCPNSGSQLIVTSHYTGLLDNEDLRDDCFWITEKDKSGASTIRSVGKTKDMRVASKEKGYRQGKLGGIPVFQKEPESGADNEEYKELSLFSEY